MSMVENVIAVYDQAEKMGINLEYEPDVVCEDISALSIDEWKRMRLNGIGGSEAGIVMGVNHFTTRAVLAMKKLGQDKEEETNAKKQYTFDYGHVMENCLGNYIHNVTGWEVFTDSRMFTHPKYPFMIADCDAFCINSEGYKCGLEFKTSGYVNKGLWKGGIYGEDALVNRPEYIWQIRHYMAVTNLYRWYLIVAFSNNADDIVIIQVDRDLEAEQLLISEEQKFWKLIERGIVPYESAYSKEQYDVLRSPSNNKEYVTDREIVLPDEYRQYLDQIDELSSQKSELNEAVDEIEDRINALRLPVIQALGDASKGVLNIEDGKQYVVTYKGTERKTADYDRLKLSYPDAYDECIKSSFSRTYRQTVKSVRKK